MTAEEILERASVGSDDLPEGWTVFPLLRSKVIIGLFGWVFGIIIGLGLFALIVPIVIPTNYYRGIFAAVLTTLLLGVFLFVGLGSAWTLVTDIIRLKNASRHRLVITPDDFVKQEGNKIIHVPLINVRHVTARGLPPPERDPARVRDTESVPNASENTLGFILGRGAASSGMKWRRKRMRAPTSLAFLDTRDDSQVIVVNDGMYGDPYTIGAVLKEYAASVQQFVL
jgi:hypothetical protein